MSKGKNENWQRETAVSIHDKTAGYFDQQYHHDHNLFHSEFLYGRWWIEKYFDEQLSKLSHGAKILDVGCGTGDQVFALLEKGFDAVGIEPSKEMKSFAEKRLPEGRVLSGTVIDLPFEDNTFDFVYAIEVFRYLNNADNLAGFREILRVLKPGGSFYGTYVNLFASDGYWFYYKIRQGSSKTPEYHVEFETPGSLRSRLKEAGFIDVTTKGAMIAGIRIAYKLGKGFGRLTARILKPIDRPFSNSWFFKPFAGHLIAIARKK